MDSRLAYHAERHGLALVDPDEFEVERHPHGKGFRISFSGGETVTDKRIRSRVKALVIPPAWTDVKICVQENGHIQAIGRDQKGRLQYRYHDSWVNVRNAVKTERLLRFGHALPKLRRQVERDMRRRKRDRRATAAVATHLVDIAAMRPGHEKYAADGGRGVASLRKQNLRIVKKVAVLKFVGKSKKEHRIEIEDKATVRALKRMREGKGKRLFRFPGETKQRELTANLLNDYLHEASEARISAKDFRTFHGSSEALRYLVEEVGDTGGSKSRKKKAVAAAMRSVAGILRNTPTVSRSSYVHPQIIEAFETDRLSPELFKGRTREGLTRIETGLMRFLEEVTHRDAERAPKAPPEPETRSADTRAQWHDALAEVEGRAA